MDRRQRGEPQNRRTSLLHLFRRRNAGGKSRPRHRRLCRSTGAIRLDPRRLRLDGPTLRRILRIGLPAGIQSAVFALSNIVIQSAINSLGKVVMAASSAAYNIEVFAYDVMNSYNQACTTFVGQNYGAGQIRRCRKTLYKVLR